MCGRAMGNDGVKLYMMDTSELSDQAYYQECYRRMSSGRRRKIDGCRSEADKKLCLSAGLILDRGLREQGLRESSVRFARGENGKPYLPDYPGIHFNLSHSKDKAMAVFARVPVGCDIEYIRKEGNMRIARRFFCPGEYAYLASFEGDGRQREEFCRLWTLKESFLKATGYGMRLPLDAFEFTLCPGGEVTVRQDVDCWGYHFKEYRFGSYRAAVCIKMPQGGFFPKEQG